MDENKDITLRKAKHQEASSNSTNSDNLYECAERTEAVNEEAQNNLVPVRLWIRGHYTKLTKDNKARCIHCNGIFTVYMNKLAVLHEHLVDKHPDKLAEEEKNEVKFHWIWDHYITISDRQATCIRCRTIIKYFTVSNLKSHLKIIHKISDPSGNEIDTESSSDDDMDVNKALRKVKRQEASSKSTNLSNNLYECAERTESINEEAQNNLVPVRLWIRGHYTKLTKDNKARCIHCTSNGIFIVYMSQLATFHKHLVDTHLDKLTEEEKKDVKFYWIWDYYIARSDRQATCKQCEAIIIYYELSELRRHLRNIHNISGPTSDNESSSDDDIHANKDITLRKVKRQEASSNLTNLSDNLYKYAEGTDAINKEAQNDLVPVRLWIRGHYTKLTRDNKTRCIHCNVIFIINMKILAPLYKHLVETHPDKLTEEEKKEVKFHWIWDHYILKSNRDAKCRRCKTTVRCYSIILLIEHLKRIHKILGPTLDNLIDNESSSYDDMGANKDIAIRKAKRQKTSSNSNKSNNLYEYTEESGAINGIFGPGSDNDMDNRNNSDNYVDADTTIKNAKHQEDFSNSTGHVTKKLKSMPSLSSNYKVNNRNSLTSVHPSISTNYIDYGTESNEFLKKANCVPISLSTGMETPNVSAFVYHSTAKSNIDSSDKVSECVRNNTCTDNFEQDDIRNNISTDNSEEVDDVPHACNENVLFLEDNVRVEDNTAFESQSTIDNIEQEMVFYPICPVYMWWPPLISPQLYSES